MNDFAAAFKGAGLDAELRIDEPMRLHTTFKIGGPADAFAIPRTHEALSGLLALAAELGSPAYVVGGGANLLVSDRGVRGVVICTAGLSAIRFEDDGLTLAAEAGAPIKALVEFAARRSMAGLEFAAGLPGSLGGAVFMNARCYDREIADLLVSVDYVGPTGSRPARLDMARDEWAYKRTPFMGGGRLRDSVVVGARLSLSPGDEPAIRARMRELENDRVRKGHFDYPSAGSMFKNDRAFGRPTGTILDELGFRGMRIGDAMVSPKHANIFVNAGSATARDMAALVKKAHDAARDAFGFELEPEVRFLGDAEDFSP
jgi:UDP-N-acetylmuramate dehydrogenase